MNRDNALVERELKELNRKIEVTIELFTANVTNNVIDLPATVMIHLMEMGKLVRDSQKEYNDYLSRMEVTK